MKFSSVQFLCQILVSPVLLSLSGFAHASDANDRLEIRDASGRYNGTFNGILVAGEDASQVDHFQSSTRMPRKKGKFTSRLLISEYEGSVEIEGNVRKIKVRGKKVRYRGVVKYAGLLGQDSPPLVGLLNAISKRNPSGRKLKYPITMSRVYEADDFDFLDDDLQVALLLNFNGEK